MPGRLWWFRNALCRPIQDHRTPAPLSCVAGESFPHPFRAELDALPVSYPDWLLQPPAPPPSETTAVSAAAAVPGRRANRLTGAGAGGASAAVQQLPPPPPPEETPLVWVDTPEALEAMVAELREQRVREVALDLEAHNFRWAPGGWSSVRA